MGARGSGRRPNLARQQRAAKLRRQGISVVDIAHALGIHRQAVYVLLHRAGAVRPAGGNHLAAKCCRCGAVLCVGDFHGNTSRTALCLLCLNALPSPTFG